MPFVRLAIALFALVQLPTVRLAETCRFADLFTIDDVMQNRDDAVHRLKMHMCLWEGKFGYGVGFNNQTGVTYDGHKIDYTTGDLHENLQFWTAASKEAIHINMLSLYLMDNVYAQQFFHNASQEAIVQILERKIDSYNDFHRRYPGFGGFLPWFAANGSAMNLLKGWESKVPGLDNGQLIWSIKILISTLRAKHLIDLADRYQQRLELMTQTAIPIFYEARRGGLRCEAGIVQMFNASEMMNPANYFTEGTCLLDDPYEGKRTSLTHLYLFCGTNRSMLRLSRRINDLFHGSLCSVDIVPLSNETNVTVFGRINERVSFATNTTRAHRRVKWRFNEVSGFPATNNGNTSIYPIEISICNDVYSWTEREFVSIILLWIEFPVCTPVSPQTPSQEPIRSIISVPVESIRSHSNRSNIVRSSPLMPVSRWLWPTNQSVSLGIWICFKVRQCRISTEAPKQRMFKAPPSRQWSPGTRRSPPSLPCSVHIWSIKLANFSGLIEPTIDLWISHRANGQPCSTRDLCSVKIFLGLYPRFKFLARAKVCRISRSAILLQLVLQPRCRSICASSLLYFLLCMLLVRRTFETLFDWIVVDRHRRENKETARGEFSFVLRVWRCLKRENPSIAKYQILFTLDDDDVLYRPRWRMNFSCYVADVCRCSLI